MKKKNEESETFDFVNKTQSLKTIFCPWKVLEKSLNFVCVKLYEPRIICVFSLYMESVLSNCPGVFCFEFYAVISCWVLLEFFSTDVYPWS